MLFNKQVTYFKEQYKKCTVDISLVFFAYAYVFKRVDYGKSWDRFDEALSV